MASQKKHKVISLLNHFEKADTSLPDFARERGLQEQDLHQLLHGENAEAEGVILIDNKLYTKASRYTSGWKVNKQPHAFPFSVYLDKHFSGNVAAFAKEMGESRRFVETLLRDEGFWVNGEVFLPVSLTSSWEAIPIKDYIEANFKNNSTAMARAYGIRQQQLFRWIEKDCMVCDGEIYMRRTTMSDGDPTVSTVAVKLKDYIRNAYGAGDEGIRLFGTDNDMITQQVKRYIGYDSMWINGDIYKNQSEFAKNGISPDFDKAFVPRKKRTTKAKSNKRKVTSATNAKSKKRKVTNATNA